MYFLCAKEVWWVHTIWLRRRDCVCNKLAVQLAHSRWAFIWEPHFCRAQCTWLCGYRLQTRSESEQFNDVSCVCHITYQISTFQFLIFWLFNIASFQRYQKKCVKNYFTTNIICCRWIQFGNLNWSCTRQRKLCYIRPYNERRNKKKCLTKKRKMLLFAFLGWKTNQPHCARTAQWNA